MVRSADHSPRQFKILNIVDGFQYLLKDTSAQSVSTDRRRSFQSVDLNPAGPVRIDVDRPSADLLSDETTASIHRNREAATVSHNESETGGNRWL
jgi:hypothetical protein